MAAMANNVYNMAKAGETKAGENIESGVSAKRQPATLAKMLISRASA
jgi:hypothetical protein